MGEWPEATEAALIAEYGGNPVRDFWRRKITLRELRVLVENLPENSAVHRRDPRSRGWTTTDYLLADNWDALNAAVMLLSGFFKQVPQMPPRRERPGDEFAREAERVRTQREQRASDEWVRNIERMTGVRR